MLTTEKPIMQYAFSISWIIDQTCTIILAFLFWFSSTQPHTLCGQMVNIRLINIEYIDNID